MLKSLVHLELILSRMINKVLFSVFYLRISSFPSIIYQYVAFSPACIMDIFVKHQMAIVICNHIWVSRFVPLTHLSLLCQCHCVHISVNLQYNFKDGITPTKIFLIRVALAS